MPRYVIDEDTKKNMNRLAPKLLFHGTRFLTHILAADELSATLRSDGDIFFSRCPNGALGYAEKHRYDFDDGRGAIIAIDRQRLEASYDVFRAREARNANAVDDGLTEWIFAPLEDLSTFVVGILRLEDLHPALGVSAPRRPACDPYVPVEPSKRERLAGELRDVVSRNPGDHRLCRAVETLMPEIMDMSSIRWPFLNGDGTLA
jgi:hypothetical protein